MKTYLKEQFVKTLPTLILLTTALSLAAATTRYVNLNSTNPVPPFTDWSTAATNIQDAVDVAVAGDAIVVTNGVYQTGTRAVFDMSNRVAVTIPVTVRSVNGPAVTQIVGYQEPGVKFGPAAVRCVYLTNGAMLTGFTLTNGATQISGDASKDSGGGVWCDGLSAVVSNCVLTGNTAYFDGGGAFSGTLNNCTLARNSAPFEYGHGGGAYDSTLNNCTLTGNSASEGGGAFRGTLNNCTVASNSASYEGGGAYGGTLNNCTLAGNSAGAFGGGVYQGTLYNCTLTGNSAYSGGGVFYGTLNNCTLTGNLADYCGGAYYGVLNNCIIYYNSARYSGANYDEMSTLNYCCTTPLPAGPGNLSEEPQMANASHLSANSPCRGRGSAAYARGFDVDGESWADSPSIGCDEYWSGSVTGALSVAAAAAYTNVAVGFGVDFQAVVEGRVSASRWDFGDGVVVSNRPWTSHAFAAKGYYTVELRAYNDSYPAGVAATVTVHVVEEEHYVALNSTSPAPPYTNWMTAATNIHDAMDIAVPGALVWVSNGVYQVGARAVDGMSNRVAVTRPVIVRSVNGPAVTQIMGHQVPGTTNGPAAVRCVYLTNGAMLTGFTLTNGATQNSVYASKNSGGGVWCEGIDAVVSNCVFTGNSAYGSGGGAFRGTLNDCVLSANSASSGGGIFSDMQDKCMLNNCTLTGNSAREQGGGACNGTLNHCTLTGNSVRGHGGGAYQGTLNNCVLSANSAGYGGGISSDTRDKCTLNNCILTGNSANYYGGGAESGTLNNCTLAGNSAGNGGGASYSLLNNCTLTGNSADYGGGAYFGMLNNCIVYYNSALWYIEANYNSQSTLIYCCTTPVPADGENLTDAPLFVNTNGWINLRLQSTCTCINAGNNAYATNTTDLDGNPRIVGGAVDIGAYEFQSPASQLSYAWLQQYGLPTDGSADFTDPDGDRANNWQEWQSATVPTNALSALRLLTPQTVGTNPRGDLAERGKQNLHP